MVMGGRGRARAIGGGGRGVYPPPMRKGRGGAHTTQRQGHPATGWRGGDIMRPVAQGLLPFAKGVTSS